MGTLFLLFFSTIGCLASLGLVNKQKIIKDRVLGIWNEGNLALINEVYAPEAVIRASHFPIPIKGQEGIKNWIVSTRAAFPDFQMTFEEIIIKGDCVITRWTTTGTHTGTLRMPLINLSPTGRKVRLSGISIGRVEKRKTVEEIVVFNAMEMFQQLGFQLTPPSIKEKK
jgi:predicted ester cyclase